MYDRSTLISVQFSLEQANAEELALLDSLLEAGDATELKAWARVVNARLDSDMRFVSASGHAPTDKGKQPRELDNDNTETAEERKKMQERIRGLIQEQKPTNGS
ncbi:MAG: hypothetical protein QM758_06710 [Armatimonas sp.]